MTAPVPIDVALRDKRLLRAGLSDDLSTWQTWIATLKAAHGRKLNEAERALFDTVAGGRAPPLGKVKELVTVASRRAGKSRMGAALAVHAAVLTDHSAVLAPGEVGVVACISPTRAQAAILLSYCAGFLSASPLLQSEVLSIGSDEIVFRNGNVIQTLAGDYRSLRGRTLLLGLLDEVGFMRDERSVRPDVEIARAVAPGLATTNGMLVLLSSPHRRSGLLWERHKASFGKDDAAVLCVQGASELFNPTLDRAWVASESARDPEAATSEWRGLFRSDLAAYLDPALIEAAIDRGTAVRAPAPNTVYHCFCDPSGGVGDSFALAVAHADAGEIVLDCVVERTAPFNPSEAVAQMAATMAEYGLRSVRGDRYSAMWCVESFKRLGVDYIHHDKDRSAVYMDCLPLFASGKVRLLDHAKLAGQFSALERTAGTNRDRVDHPRGAGYHDDLCNAAAGALTLCATARYDAPHAVMLNGWSGERFRVACTRFRGHRVRCHSGAGGGLWNANAMHESSSLRL